MTAETDLLPLPEPNGSYTNPYDGDDLENYARANVAHAVATLQAEVEALRERIASLQSAIDEAPVAMLSEGPGGRGYVKAHLSRHATVEPPIGQRVRLVRED